MSFIIDPGYFDNDLKNYLNNIKNLKFILLTHCHFDHIMGINQLLEMFPDVKIYAFCDELTNINDPKINGSISFLNKVYRLNKTPFALSEGKNNIDGISFKVIKTPGHTFGSVCYYFKDDNVLFSGDFIFKASVGRTDLPTGSEFQLYQSINKFKSYAFKDDLMICPGHDEKFTYDKLKLINPFFN